MSLGLFESLPEDVFNEFWNLLDAEGLAKIAQLHPIFNARAQKEDTWKRLLQPLFNFNTYLVRLPNCDFKRE
jgi:hypothetical protein